jgi:alkylmercury lyase
MTLRTPSLAALAGGLADTFPGAADGPLARALLALLARGDPITDERLAVATNRAPRDVNAVLASWPNVHRDDRGAVVAFGGLSLLPTKHRFHVAGRELFTWCAWDTLFLPALINEPAEIRSTCPLTGRSVRLRADAGGVIDAEPVDVAISFPPLASTATRNIVESFCCHVHFVAGHDAAEKWLSEHRGGRVLALMDAYEVGKLATARLRNGTAAG